MLYLLSQDTLGNQKENAYWVQCLDCDGYNTANIQSGVVENIIGDHIFISYGKCKKV